ncbi:MAG: hypothetical protein SWO11_01885 [Thermodesulfobacteriota bacterium]|nr:hypothetical protein [Thermodesulfobacteriota bacterium]
MISPEIQKTLVECVLEFNVKAVWIFGSLLEDDSVAHDIDLAVEGVPQDQMKNRMKQLRQKGIRKRPF